ncbi:hypothetical protein LOZ61_000628 [Ophidiomyces ophidiicola]|nr:hypothetical protein LOZ61_000628 [Ophidiomyces ophidiicola]KAI1927700.1 hypothetical protein LOZ60_002959 [Ophidiomyces ophidiicola]KAI1965609.1 hypothetical protein LOZ59_001167 [Ophidiomyces ophidiicola]KAI1972770.1 hypothetical protein LOZ56_002289 [Ophidiomyces ophidiicola]KAI2013536.1 hypothetical protein LOZ49_001971 [Ophidiomyces ophidiicola]
MAVPSGIATPPSLGDSQSAGTDSDGHDFSPTSPTGHQGSRSFRPNASLVLVGIRGCGKRSLGFIAATALNWRFITEDYYFKETVGCSRQEFLQAAGRQEFHRMEVEVLRQMLDNHQTNCVIECGLGSLTQSTQEYLQQYALANPVVHVLRDMEQIQTLLNLPDNSMQLLRSTDLSHRSCSNFEFYNLEDHSSDYHGQNDAVDRKSDTYAFKLKNVRDEFTNFVRVVTGVGIPLSGFDSPFAILEDQIESRLHTHSVQVRLSDLLDGLVEFSELEAGGDALELCVDVWPPDALSTMSKYVSILRRVNALPIIFSTDIRALEKLSLSPSEVQDIYFESLTHGLRLGVEYMSIDLSWDAIADHPATATLFQCKRRTKIIGHFFLETVNGPAWQEDECLRLYQKAEHLGCDLVRLLQVAKDRLDNEAVCAFRVKVRNLPGNHPPLIAYNVGILGRTSQIFNQVLTCVTHSAIKRKHDPEGYDPLITQQHAVEALFRSYVPDPLQFYVIGENGTYNLYPAMYNAAFQSYGMAHTYNDPGTTSLADLDRLTANPNFGGASIVLPYRVQIIEHLTAKSRHAETIGAVNAVLPLRVDSTGYIYPLKEQANQRSRAGRIGGLYGDNTDWVSIFVCLRRGLSPRNAISPLKSTGLVIGAGGMARAAIYAMLKLGCRNIFVYNRTIEHAEIVARHFSSLARASSASASSSSSLPESGNAVRVLGPSTQPWPSDFALPCMIVSCVPANTIGGDAPLELPGQWLESPTGGVVLELALNPPYTKLLQQVTQYRSQTETPWVLVDGFEVAAEQGIAQFELQTGSRAPRRLMRRQVLQNYPYGEGPYDENAINARLEKINGIGY